MKQEQTITPRNPLELFLDEYEVDLADAEELKALDLIERARNSLNYLSVPNPNELEVYKEAATHLNEALKLIKSYRDNIWDEDTEYNYAAYQIYSELNDIRLYCLSSFDRQKLKVENGMDFNLRGTYKEWEYELIGKEVIENTLD